MSELPTDCRPTRLEVDLHALGENLRDLQAQAAPAKLWPVVKANAYGHGIEAVAQELARLGVDGLCVATFAEGQRLRTIGIETPIVILGGAFGTERSDARAHNLLCAVRDLEDLRSWSELKDKRIALKVDCGMHRLGISSEHASEVADLVAPGEVAMVLAHLPSNEVIEEDARTQEQLDVFDAFFARLVSDGVCTDATPRSALNSAGCVRGVFHQYDVVRAGLALYGMDPRPEVDELRPCARLVSAINSLRDITAGERVGYAGTFVATRPTRVATVPIGYGDGYIRANSGRAQVLVCGKRANVIGRVSMDQTTIDVTAIPEARRGDEVVLLGSQSDDRINADELASWSQTISYEVTTLITNRVPRRYLR